MQPPFPDQKLLAAPKQLAEKITKTDFFDFKNNNIPPTTHKFIGFAILTLILVGGFYLLAPMAVQVVKSQKELIQGYVPVSSEPRSMSIEIQNPDDELLTFNNSVVVSGKTSPKAAVVITNGSNYVGTDADGDGNFQKVIDLNIGVNQLNIQAFDTEGNTKSDTRMVYYSEEKL